MREQLAAIAAKRLACCLLYTSSLNSSSGSVMPLDRGMAMAYTWLTPLRLSATALTVDWYFSASEPT